MLQLHYLFINYVIQLSTFLQVREGKLSEFACEISDITCSIYHTSSLGADFEIDR